MPNPRFPLLPPLLMLLLASCSPGRNQFPPACPVPSLVKPLDEIARSRGGSPDIRDLAVRARISDVGGKCSPGDNNGLVSVTAQVTVDATRGPGLEGDTAQLPVFVAVTDATAVLDKRLFNMSVTFPRNVDTVRVVGPDIVMALPVSPERSAASYGVIGGFQLTPEEVAAARGGRRR